MDEKFTKKLQEWILTPDDKKDYAKGALMLLQLNGNKVMYRQLSVNPKGKADFIIGKLQKYLTMRLAHVTHEEVVKMEVQVKEIEKKTIKAKSEFEEFKAGKRVDHDKLPEEVQALYVENLDIVHHMRELHLKLRQVSGSSISCLDSEKYPFLKELIELDKKLHANWDTYDHYVVKVEKGKTKSQKQKAKS